MKRVLTGDRPTGRLHLGHYVGALSQRVELQDAYEMYIMAADVQAMTDNFEQPEKVRKNVLEVVLDNLAVGVDPNKVTFFLQSQIPAIAELFVYFSNFVSIEQLAHNPTIKTELKEKQSSKAVFQNSTPLGFYSYPVHQAADIMCVNADLVPVGEDQLPHIELCRDVVRRFNTAYNSDFLHIPEARVTKIARLPGLDGNAKMSKSLNNAIYLADASHVLREKVFLMYTDPNRIHAHDPGKVEGNTVFLYHDVFNPNQAEVAALKERYQNGTVGDVEVKERLFQALNTFLEPIRERRKDYEQHRDEVLGILLEGTQKVKKISNELIERVKEIMQLNGFVE